jgi:predicted CXXCH cytochrome family protein
MRQKTALACILFAAALLALVVLSVENPPHAFKDCASCHVLTNPTGARARDLTQPVTLLCNTCHEKTLTEGYMHPINIRPERVIIPEDMPLSRSGQLVCTTCHDVHAEYFTAYGAPTHFLRRQELGKAFCRICHENLNSLSQGHKASLGEAHFRSGYIMTDPRQDIDPMSMNCLSCHDGTYATSVTVRAGVWKHGRGFMKHNQGSHPIGVDYENVRLQRGRKTDLRPLIAVDRRIRFFKGKVGCGSCHDPYSTSEKKLVMSDEHSNLCFACHIV